MAHVIYSHENGGLNLYINATPVGTPIPSGYTLLQLEGKYFGGIDEYGHNVSGIKGEEFLLEQSSGVDYMGRDSGEYIQSVTTWNKPVSDEWKRDIALYDSLGPFVNTATVTVTPTPTVSATYTITPTSTPIISTQSGFGSQWNWVPFGSYNTGPRGLTVSASGNTLTMYAGDSTEAGNYRCYYAPSLTWNIFTIAFSITDFVLNYGGSATYGFSVAVRYEDDANYALIAFHNTGGSEAEVNILSTVSSYWFVTYRTQGLALNVGDRVEIRISDDGPDYSYNGSQWVYQGTDTSPRIRLYQNGTLFGDFYEAGYGSTPRRHGGYGIRAKSITKQVVFSLTDLTTNYVAPTPTLLPTYTFTPTISPTSTISATATVSATYTSTRTPLPTRTPGGTPNDNAIIIGGD